jgi:hypothetical protein
VQLPEQRNHNDMAILMTRTAHLKALAQRPHTVHFELCRAMVYRKVDADFMLVRKGTPAESFYIVMYASPSP